MSTPGDLVEVRVGELVHTGWTRYEIDSDLLTPADAWSVELAQSTIKVPDEVTVGAPVEVRLGGELVLSGRLDDRDHAVEAGRHVLRMSGRDGAAVLLDCSAPIITRMQLSLQQVVATIVRPLGLTRFNVDAVNPAMREKFSCEPGDCAWDALRRAAEANGLWPWFEPDGTLVVGGPNYDQEPVATLVLRADGVGNNVERLQEQRSIHGRYSEVTVLGQAHAAGSGAGELDGRNAVRSVQRDTGVPTYRPYVTSDHEAINESIAAARAKKIISDARIKSYTLQADVTGHRTESGVLWKPGQRVNVVSEPHGLDATFFLMARKFSGGNDVGQRTMLTLKEDRAWVLDAHPSKRRHRRGKNDLPGKIIDLSKGGAS
jgi:prophage tail gpP-like protein